MSKTSILFISPGADDLLVKAILATQGQIESYHHEDTFRAEGDIRALLDALQGEPVQVDLTDNKNPMNKITYISAVVTGFSPMFVACWPSHTDNRNQRIEGGFLVHTEHGTNRYTFPWREGDPDLDAGHMAIAGMDEKEALTLLARLDAVPAHHLVNDDRLVSLIPDYPMDFEEWLEWSGQDSSFVGDKTMGIPGTYAIYEAAMERMHNIEDAPEP